MDTSRRATLRMLAAAPVVAAAGSLWAPGTANAAQALHAAADTTPAPDAFSLEPRLGPTKSGPAYTDLIKDLVALRGLRFVKRSALLEHGPSRARRIKGGQSGAPEKILDGFAWGTRADRDGRSWMPQGVTTSYDAYGADHRGADPEGFGRTWLLVSWYLGKPARDARVTFVDITDMRNIRYRHVKLVEPYQRAGRTVYRPVAFHTGGLAWYRNRLYVPDTKHGLRVFAMDHLMRQTWNGGRSTTYLLPQSAAYDNDGTGLAYSAVSLDRTHGESEISLVVNEFHHEDGKGEDVPDPRGNGDRTPRVVRWRLKPGTEWIESKAANEFFPVPGGWNAQGAVLVGGTYYLSRSAGGRPGSLLAFPRGNPVPKKVRPLATGCEDLSYDGRYDALWNLSEYPGKRSVCLVSRFVA
ncbi:hypothetical protein [Streptomyces sp. NPDC018347]|uniref:hypothetical protein n=1 Tax=Streptomyces sp. NPDC018347 TaxID=3157193 RepID=UPI0033EBE2A7